MDLLDELVAQQWDEYDLEANCWVEIVAAADDQIGLEEDVRM